MSTLKSPKFIIGTIVVLAIMVASRILFPITLPHISLAPETIGMLGSLPFTNTMLALLISEIILLVMVIVATRRMDLVPSGLQNFFEAIVEFWEEQSRQLIGEKLARTWLPLILAVFLLIWFSNYLHFLPGFDSIGILCQPGHCPGETTVAHEAPEGEEAHAEDDGAQHTLFTVQWYGGEPGEGLGNVTGKLEHEDEAAADDADAAEASHDDASAEAADKAHDESADEGHEEGAAVATSDGGDGHDEGYAFVPLFRVAASDLNFTIMLALVSFIAVEVIGFRTHGIKYLTKFFHIDFSHGIGQGLLNIFVGLIELISELARVISWSFRLFGNIFAGSVLLVVFMFLVPFFLAVPIYGLELFVGLIQAFVFSILILAFITLAVAPLHGDDH